MITQEATGKNVILLPMGAADDGAHSQNEKIDIRCRAGLLFGTISILSFCLFVQELHRGDEAAWGICLPAQPALDISRGRGVYLAT